MNEELRLDLENTSLWSGSREIRLSPKAFAVVQCLLAHQGQIVSKSKLLEVVWPDEEISEAALTSTIRDLRQALGDKSRSPRYIETRHRLGYRWIAQTIPAISQPNDAPTNPSLRKDSSKQDSCRQDWGEASDIPLFCGREPELATLTTWVMTEHCRLIALLGLGGIGKSSLSVKFAQQVVAEFDYLIWRSLRNAPLLGDLVEDLVAFLTEGCTSKGTLVQLLECLRTSRCLIILDNLETIFQDSQWAGQYRVGYEDYGELFRLIGETPHTSCLVLTSREKPAEVSLLEGQELAVKSIQLGGSLAASLALLQAKGLVGSDELRQQLCLRYDCSPLAIKIVSTSIQELFDGQIERFLAQDAGIFGGLDRLLNQQFNRMSALEQSIAYWLTLNRQWTTPAQLEADLVPKVPKRQLLGALESLSHRSFLEQQAGQYTQQPVVMEYITQRLIEQVIEELLPQELLSERLTPEQSLLAHYPLVKTTVAPDIRDSQTRLILAPIAAYLQTALAAPPTLRQHLQNILERVKAAKATSVYGAGNLINLARYLQVDLAGFDFSGLHICHANLQGATLQGVNFAHCHFADTVFTQIFGGILALACSPDGQILACGDASGAVHLWHRIQGKLLQTLKQHRGWVWSLAWSPDSKTLATGGDDQTIRLWEVGSGEALGLLPETSAVWALAWSPDGQTLASGSFDKTVKLWQPHTGACLQTWRGHEDLVASVAWQPDGTVLASGSLDHTVKLWQVSTGVCVQTLRQHKAGVRAVTWHPAGKTLASSSADGTIKLWNTHTHQVINSLEGHEKLVAAIAWSPDGTQLVSGGYDKQVLIWDAITGQRLKTLSGHSSEVWSVAWCPMPTLTESSSTTPTTIVVSGSYDKTVKVWDVERGECLNTLQGSTSGVCAVAWSPVDISLPSGSAQLLASGGEDNAIRLWDPATGHCLKTLQGHKSGIWSVAWSADGHWLASASADRTIKLWDAQSGKCLKTLSGEDWILSVAWCPAPRQPPQTAASLANDCYLLASGSACRQMTLWDTRTGQPQRTCSDHRGFVWSVAWSADGTRLASGSADCQVRIWQRQTGDCLATFQGHTGFIWSVAWGANQILASGSDDRTIQLWDANTGQAIRTLAGHRDAVRAVAWHPLGRVLASGSHDGEIRLWDASSGQELQVLAGHGDRVYSLAWSQDGQTLASSSADETIALWDTSTGVCLRTLSPERPYQDANFTGAVGLTTAQQATLIALGAQDSVAHT